MSEGENIELKTENSELDSSYPKYEALPTETSTQLPYMKNNISPSSSEVFLRQKSRDERPESYSSSTFSPSYYLTPKRPISTPEFQKNLNMKDCNKKSDMVLQLVIPRSNNGQQLPFNSNLFTNSTQNSPVLSNRRFLERQQSTLKTPRTEEDGRGSELALSPSVLSSSSFNFSTHPDTPTPYDQKKKAFSDILTNTCSVFYALFIITVGLVLSVASIIDKSKSMAEIYSLILLTISCLFIMFLILDMSIFTKKQQKYQKQIDQHLTDHNIQVTELPDGDFQFNIILPDVVKLRKKLRHDYCFNYDRHSTNFYIKVGAAAFCLGHLIHLGLLIGYQFVLLTDNEMDLYECISVHRVALNFVYPIYSFLLLFFIFKYSNVIINKSTVLARLGIMHCLSTSVCCWGWTIVREVLDALASKQKDEVNTEMNTVNPDEAETEFIVRRFTNICSDDAALSNILRKFSPYLYPFSVEFSILIVGVLYLMWNNIKKCAAERENEHSTVKCKKPMGNADNEKGNIVIYANCHASNKGLFGGFVILLITLISCILFFIFIYGSSGDKKNLDYGILVNNITAIMILSSMLVVTIAAYKQITKLDLNSGHHNPLDDILLYICIPAFMFHGIFSIIPAIVHTNVMMLVFTSLETIQVLVQTVFLLDGVRRSSNTKKLRLLKPGRELVTFLIITNISLWIFQTFEVKVHDLTDERYEYFGKELWTILGHMCLPLMMFYRFHSSVCLCDIWKYAYEPSGH